VRVGRRTQVVVAAIGRLPAFVALPLVKVKFTDPGRSVTVSDSCAQAGEPQQNKSMRELIAGGTTRFDIGAVLRIDPSASV